MNLFRKPTPARLAREELAEAQRWLLHWQSQQEHVEAMVQMNQKRVERLQLYLGKHGDLEERCGVPLSVVNNQQEAA